MAACGARAAAGDAGDRVSQRDSPAVLGSRLRAFRHGLNEAGYVEGRNVAIEYRWAEGQNDRLPASGGRLGSPQVAVIAAPGSTLRRRAAKAATTTIPIVFATGGRPGQAGLVASLNRPGGNVTGVTFWACELGPKQLELLHELIPTATVIGLLVNPTNPNRRGSMSNEVQGGGPHARA